MNTFRNLRLAVRLGVAFGALALGLAIVAAVAFLSAGHNQTALDSLVEEDIAALTLVSDLGERTESQDAAGQISSLIGEIQRETDKVVGVVAEGAKRTQDGVATVDVTRGAFEQIGASVGRSSALSAS